MKDFFEQIIFGPILLILFLLFQFFILPAIIFSRIIQVEIPSRVIKKGPLKGQKMLDIPICLFISGAFWFLLWLAFALPPRIE